MTLKELRAALKRVNLTHLAQQSKVDLRTLRRIKQGDTGAHASTVEKIEKALRRGVA